MEARPLIGQLAADVGDWRLIRALGGSTQGGSEFCRMHFYSTSMSLRK